MKKPLQRLKAFVKHPTTQLVTGLVMVITGLSAVREDLVNAEHSFRLGVHHGVLLFGLVQVLGSLPDLVDGLERAFGAAERQAPGSPGYNANGGDAK